MLHCKKHLSSILLHYLPFMSACINIVQTKIDVHQNTNKRLQVVLVLKIHFKCVWETSDTPGVRPMQLRGIQRVKYVWISHFHIYISTKLVLLFNSCVKFHSNLGTHCLNTSWRDCYFLMNCPVCVGLRTYGHWTTNTFTSILLQNYAQYLKHTKLVSRLMPVADASK